MEKLHSAVRCNADGALQVNPLTSGALHDRAPTGIKKGSNDMLPPDSK
jgi:hypothetical protein